MDTAVPVEHVELSEKGKIAFATPSGSMNAVCNVYNTDSKWLTDLHEMDTEDSRFRNLALVLTDHPYHIQGKTVYGISKPEKFHWKSIRDLVGLWSKVLDLELHRHMFFARLQIDGWYQTVLDLKWKVFKQQAGGL